jgi:hypothetical protein
MDSNAKPQVLLLVGWERVFTWNWSRFEPWWIRLSGTCGTK